MAHSGQAALAKEETYAYASDSNRLLRVDSQQGINQESRSLDYDSVGNIVQDSRQGDGRTLRYGAANRLLDVSAANDEQTSKVPGSDYRYNAKGQRVIKMVDGQAIHFHYDAFDRLISETNDQGFPLREYIYGAGQRLALVDYEHSDIPKLGAIRYVLNDHLGTPQLLLDTKQSIVWSAQGTRTPFGENLLASNDSNVKQPLQFPGQYADETGYSYNYFRDYDPSLGRYIQSDPIGLGGGVNTFGYVSGNPLVRVDVLGLTDYGALFLETTGLVLSTGEVAGGGTLFLTGLFATPTGFGTIPGAAAMTLGGAGVLHGAHGMASALQGIQNAWEGTNHGGPLEQLGSHVFGERAGKIGKGIESVLSLRGMAKSIRNVFRGSDSVSDIHGSASAVKKGLTKSNQGQFCPVGG